MNTTRILTIAAITLVSLLGCKRASSDVPVRGFRLTLEDIVADGDIRVARLAINSTATGTISVDAEGSHQSAALEESSAGKAAVTLMGSRVTPSGQPWSYMQSLIRIQAAGVTTGGPALDTLPQATQLNGFFAITARNGDYAFDTPAEIATLRGKPVTLTLKRSTP